MKNISIITINLNNRLGLKETIESLLYQSYKNYEFIVIDGGSNDGSVDLIKEFDKHIDYWISEPDNGIFSAMNKGILKANSEYCIFMNSGDCFCHDNVLKEIFLHQLTGDIICGDALYRKSAYHNERIVISPSSKYRASEFILSSIPHQSTLIKTDLFKKYHLYDENYQIFSDWAFVVEMIFHYGREYQKINVLISSCDTTGISSNPQHVNLMKEEFNIILKKIFPNFYEDYDELQKYRNQENNNEVLFLKKIEKTFFFKALNFFRRRLKRYGFYKFKSKLKRAIYYYKLNYEDVKKKKKIKKHIYKLPNNILPQRKNDEIEIIISLTSYGKRVSESAPYAIYTLFKQDMLPHKVILNLDYDNWNDNNLPSSINRLKMSGLIVDYCKDIRSYKKLIPTLEKYSDSIIITVDDDMYYNPKLLSELINAFSMSDKKTILCHYAYVVERKNGKFTFTKDWRKEGNSYSIYSPLGVGGVLYPPNIFDSEVFKDDIFMRLSPTADDLWFWVMAIRRKIKIELLKESSNNENIPIDRIMQLAENAIKSDGLFVENCLNGMNDIQLQKLFDYYNI